MNALMLVLFWGSLLAVAYAYAGYPWLLRVWARWRHTPLRRPAPAESPLRVSVLFAAHNEERVIARKLASLLASHFPATHLEILVGDDASDDGTAAIVRAFAQEYPAIRLVSFAERRGKPAVINKLAFEARGDVLVFTDADILFAREAIERIAAWFQLPDVGVVAANIQARRRHADGGVAVVEDAYVRREIGIKRRQSEISGVVIAPFGACYAIRRTDFHPVPVEHSVDDFFISLLPQAIGRRAIQALDVVCYEDFTGDAADEFRRKVRMSRGNFQNLAFFRVLACRVWTPLGFHLFSHKVLRWFSPELLAVSVVACAWLALDQPFHLVLLGLMVLAFCTPWIDGWLRRRGRRVGPIRFAAHFLHMNVALAVGFLQWLAGHTGGVWEPTRRK